VDGQSDSEPSTVGERRAHPSTSLPTYQVTNVGSHRGIIGLVPDQRELAQDRSLRYHELKASLGGGLAALTPAQRQHQLNMAEERLIIREAREADEREQQRLTKLRASARRRAEERAAAKASHRRPTSPRQAKHEEAKAVPA
jgi:hypothetical protein